MIKTEKVLTNVIKIPSWKTWVQRPVSLKEERTLKKVSNCLNTNIQSYLETSGGQISNPYLNVVLFSTLELIRNLWQLKTAVFLHWCLTCVVPLKGSASALVDNTLIKVENVSQEQISIIDLNHFQMLLPLDVFKTGQLILGFACKLFYKLVGTTSFY